MMKRINHNLEEQVKKKIKETKIQETPSFSGNINTMISTGSTLLDLAISGGLVRGGGIPGGILVEIFGPAGTGKTVLLSEIAGDIQRKGGKVMFHDPEARLNKQFASIFGLDVQNIKYGTPDTIPQVFSAIREWEIDTEKNKINGILADSLAALSTNLEMDNKEGDKMGMRRAKEFSEELRKTCRILVDRNLLLVCSNQIRQNMDAGPYGQKYISPGGQSIGFYSSLRLRTSLSKKIKIKKKIKSKEFERIIGIEINIEIFKSSVWKPFHKAPVTIIFDYGVDDIRQNLQYIKKYTGKSIYTVNEIELGNSITKAIAKVEEDDLVQELKEQVIDIWELIENSFVEKRKLKQR